jgi:hypothetical protein
MVRALTTEASDGSEEPPALFQKNVTDLAKRRTAWNAKTAEQQYELRASLEENAKAGRIPHKQ